MTTEGPPQQNPEQAGIQKAEQLLDYMESSFGRNASPEGRQAFDFNKFWIDAKDLAGVKKGGIAILETPDFRFPFASYGANKELWGNVINALADEAENAYRNGNTSEKQKEVRKGLAVAVALGMNNTHGDHYLTATKEFIEGLRKIYGTKEPEEKFGNRVKHALTDRFRKRQPHTNQISDEQGGQAEETEEENPFADLIGELDSLAEQNQKTEANEEVELLLEELQKVYTIPEEESQQESNLRHKRQSEIETQLRNRLGLENMRYVPPELTKFFEENILPHMLELNLTEGELQNTRLTDLLTQLFEAHSPKLAAIFEKYKSGPSAWETSLEDLVIKAVCDSPQTWIDQEMADALEKKDEATQQLSTAEKTFENDTAKGLIRTPDDFTKAVAEKDQRWNQYLKAEVAFFESIRVFYADLAEKAGLRIVPGRPGGYGSLIPAHSEQAREDRRQESGWSDEEFSKLLEDIGIINLPPDEAVQALDGMGGETAAAAYEEIKASSPDQARAIAEEKAKVNEEWFLQALKSGERDEVELAYSSLTFVQRKKYRSQLDQFNNA